VIDLEKIQPEEEGKKEGQSLRSCSPISGQSHPALLTETIDLPLMSHRSCLYLHL
jgi:hypothetical protein